MALLVPLGLIFLSKLTDIPEKNAEKKYNKKRSYQMKSSYQNSKPDLNIVGPPFYQVPNSESLALSNERISYGVGEVEKSVENVQSYYEGINMEKNKNIENILNIVRNFIRDNELVIYGGTAINALLPPQDQFYDYSKEIPDYDFYSSDAKNDAKRLADILFAAGFKDAQARSGIHDGTYKVSADFTQVADITQLPKNYIEQIDVVVGDDGLFYAGPMWLRIDMYKQLSEMKGNQSRWPKVWKRLQLLNRNYPIGATECTLEFCGGPEKCESYGLPIKEIMKKVIEFANSNGLVFVGGLSRQIYQNIDKSTTEKITKLLENYACLQDRLCLVDLLSENAYHDAQELKNILQTILPGKSISIQEEKNFDELFSSRYAIQINGKPIVEIIQPELCFGYLEIEGLRYGTIDTILTLLMSIHSLDNKKYTVAQKGKYFCMIEFLMGLLEKYEFSGNSLILEFPMQCIGKQNVLSDVFKERWQERVDRLKLENDGIYQKPKNLLYRPYDVFLAKRGEINKKYIFEQ